MKRVLIDTNIYIDFMNTGRGSDVALHGDLLRYMSTLVLMELQAGATNVVPARRFENASIYRSRFRV